MVNRRTRGTFDPFFFFKKKKREKKGRRSSQSAISIGLEKNPPFFFTCIVSLPSISKCDRAE